MSISSAPRHLPLPRQQQKNRWVFVDRVHLNEPAVHFFLCCQSHCHNARRRFPDRARLEMLFRTAVRRGARRGTEAIVEFTGAGERVVVGLGPQGEGFTKRCVGREASEASMTVEPRRGSESGQAVEQFEWGDDKGQVALGTGLGGVVAVAVSRGVDLTQAFLGKGGPGALAQQPLTGIAFVGGDEYVGLQTSTSPC